jgi:RNA polymerase sigma-70 factor (ECF subfamily)
MNSAQTMHEPTSGAPSFRDELVELIPVLRAFARSLCRQRGAADDLTQETLAKAWQARQRFQEGTNLKAWLFAIMRNEFYSNYRRSKIAAEYAAGQPRDSEPVEAEQDSRLDLADLMRAFSQLAPEQREALILTSCVFSYNEAAEICGCALGTIKSRVARARRQLQNLMEGSSGRLPARKDRVEDISELFFSAAASAATPREAPADNRELVKARR